MSGTVGRISDDTLADYWFKIKHQVFEALTKAFRESPYTQDQVAVRLGKSPSQISRLMSGQQNMTLRTMNELARGMGYRLRINLDRLDQIQGISNRPRHDTSPPAPVIPAVNQVNRIISTLSPQAATTSTTSIYYSVVSQNL